MQVPEALQNELVQAGIICLALFILLWFYTTLDNYVKIGVPALLFLFFYYKATQMVSSDMREDPLVVFEQIATSPLGQKIGLDEINVPHPINFHKRGIEFRFNQAGEIYFTIPQKNGLYSTRIGADGKVKCPHKTRVFFHDTSTDIHQISKMSVSSVGRTKREEMINTLEREGYVVKSKKEEEAEEPEQEAIK